MIIEEKLSPIETKIKFSGLTDEKLIHIYFQNLKNKKDSFGKNIFDLTDDFAVNLFPGRYDIYFYGLDAKTSTTMKVYSTCMKKNIEIFSYGEISMIPEVLSPEVETKKTSENWNVSIMMNELYDILSLSAFSLKQGSEKLKSFDYEYDEFGKKYFSSVPDIKGSWYMNVSYSIKSKIDEEVLKKDNINISTSYFSNLNLGEF
jgi:hypothetical protein